MAKPHPSPFSHREPALDGLRGLAVLLVYVYHYGGGLHSEHIGGRALGYLAESGWTGVVLFFVLSGFLITRGLLRSAGERHQLRNFYIRRALRILPLYYVSLALAFVFALASSVRYDEMKPLLVYAAFLQNVPPFVALAAAAPPPLPLYHFWTLAVEEQFYLLWPAVVLLWARRGLGERRSGIWLCLLLFGASAAFRAVLWGPAITRPLRAEWAASLPVHGGALVLGGALAFATGARGWSTRSKAALPVLLAGLTVYLALGWRTGSLDLKPPAQIVLGLAAVSVAAGALILLSLRSGPLQSALSVAPLRWLGRISYGVYIFHILLEPLFDTIGQHFAHLEYGATYQAVRFVVALPLSIMVAAISFFLLESPFLDFKVHFPLASARQPGDPHRKTSSF